MRTESLRLGLISVSLILALVFSMVFIAQPVLAPLVIYEPGGTTIEVEGGQEFTLRFRLRWDIEGELGYFSLAVYWDCPEDDPSENFTLENAAAYFDLDNDNLPDPGEDPIDLIVDNYEKPWGTGTRYSIVVHHDAGDSRDGEFNVDLKMRASGAGGVPHAPTNKHWIVISGTIDVPEGPIWYSYSPPNPFITIRVLGRGVGVEISEPRYQSGAPGTTLNYSVMVTNTGDIEDNYELTVSDNSGWELTLSDNLVDNRLENVQPGENENRIVTLSVTIPEDVENCAEDNITVTATGTGVENSDSCVAHALVLRGVEVAILPSYQSGSPGSMLGYIITVSNAGNVEDIYDLSVSDNEGWGDNIWLDNVTLAVPASDNRTTTLHVQIPGDAIPCTEDKITVTATSQADPTVSAENSCIAHALAVRGVEVSILPPYQENLPGSGLTYNVIVTNTGNIVDSYDLTVSDNEGWGDNIWLDNVTLAVPASDNRTTMLHVQIPGNAIPCTEDKITVNATSTENDEVSAENSCTAHVEAPVCGVDVTVEPKHQRGTPCTWLTFVVRVHNTGNIEDNYLLSVMPNGWPMENIYFEDDFLVNVDPCETRTTYLYVHIPDNALPCTHKEIVVVAESEFCGTTGNDNALIQMVSAYLHAEDQINLEDPVCTYWHELYPNFSKLYHLENWDDTNGNGKLSPCDQIELKDNETGEVDNYHVKDITVTLLISKKPDLVENMYLDLEGDFENWDNLKKDPECTQWHEIWPDFSKRYHLMSWEDENLDGALGPSDQIAMMDKETGEAHWYHVDEVATDLVLCKKPAIVRGVDVSISPSYQANPPGENLTYIVTVANTGNVDENYDLSKSDNEGWGDNIQLDNITLEVPAGEDRTTTLRVHIPDDAIPCTQDKITVKATSQADPTVSAENSCIAHVEVLVKVEVSILPEDQSGPPGETLTYEVTVTNWGNIDDTFKLEASDMDVPSWNPTLSDNLVDNTLENVQPKENRIIALSVTVPPDASLGENHTIEISATSRADPTEGDSDSCTAQATELLRVKVSILPENQSGAPGETLNYTVTVINKGNIFDTYDLTITETLNWGPKVSPTSLPIDADASDNATLSVTIPEDAGYGTEDNITVTATSTENAEVSAENSCIAHVPVCGVDVTVEPEHQRGTPGTWLTFLVIVHNTGDSVDDYDLRVENDGWPVENIKLDNEQLENIQPCESKVTKLHVHIPENAEPCTHKEIVVVAESKTCHEKDNDNVLIQVVSAYLHGEDQINLEDPVCTYWHELYPNFSKRYHLENWEDNNDDGKLSPCDQIELKDNETEEVDNYHVKDVTITILISKKPDLVENMYLDFEGDFENWDNLKRDPECTQWHEIRPVFSKRYHLLSWEDENYDNVLGPSDQIEMMNKENGETHWYHVDEVATDIVLCKKPPFVIVRGVDISISPPEQENLPGENLTYTVTVANTGNVDENYDLSLDDNEGWGDNIQLDNITLEVPASEISTTTLRVRIPADAIPCTQDNITVTAASQAEPAVSAENSCIAHAKVVVNVEVSILPESTGGPPGGTLTYEVTVTNKGNIVDTFDLKVSDMADPSWNPTLSDNLVNNSLEDVRPDESRIVALSVTVHPDASIDEEDTIEVSATSRTDKTVGDSDDCTAKATEFRRVEVSISPDNQSGEPEENLPYTVMVKNLGNISDDYSLEVSDNENWYLTLSDNLLNNVGPGENGIVTLTVIIPEDVENGAEDNITVIATSTENAEVSDSASCTATAIVARGVEVSILPENQEGPPGETLNYEVTVTNKGNIADNYTLTVSDNEGWVPRLLDNLLEVPPDENRTTTLRVTIFTGAAHSTKDNVTVTATSQRDNTMRDNASCIAHAIIVRGVGVSVDPIYKSDEPGETLSYTVTVTNTGNVTDSYDLTLSDSAAPSWNPTVSPTSLTIAAEESDTATLSVTIPSTAVHGEKDNIRVVATSREDAGVSASASCEAEVSILFGVEISVSPSSGSGQPGTSLTYTVTVRNAGLTDDTYTLRAVGAEGWSISIDPTSLSIAAGASDNATLTIIIPKGAENGTSMTTTVSAKSGEDPAMIKTDSCRTVVTGVAEEPGVELPVPLAISVALIGAAIIVPAYLLRERRKKAARRRVLRDIGFGAYRVK